MYAGKGENKADGDGVPGDDPDKGAGGGPVYKAVDAHVGAGNAGVGADGDADVGAECIPLSPKRNHSKLGNHFDTHLLGNINSFAYLFWLTF